MKNAIKNFLKQAKELLNGILTSKAASNAIHHGGVKRSR